MHIFIRHAVVNDLPTLVDFQMRLALESENLALDRITVSKGIAALFEDPSKGKYFIAELDGEIAGCHSVTFEWSDWRNGMVWWIQSVYVVEKHRKHGIFRAMFNNLQTIVADDPSLQGLRLYVDKSNTRAQQVYHNLGMNGEHYSVFEWMK